MSVRYYCDRCGVCVPDRGDLMHVESDIRTTGFKAGVHKEVRTVNAEICAKCHALLQDWMKLEVPA